MVFPRARKHLFARPCSPEAVPQPPARGDLEGDVACNKVSGSAARRYTVRTFGGRAGGSGRELKASGRLIPAPVRDGGLDSGPGPVGVAFSF